MKKYFVKLIVLFLCILIYLNIPSTSQHTYPEKNQYTPLLTALNITYPKGDGSLRIMTYNLLADTPGFEGAPAYSRADGVCAILNTLKPDVIALQETSRNWFYSLNQSTPYKFISPVKTNILGTMTTLIYNPETLFLNYWGEYVFPKNHNGRLRCAVWGVFKERSTGKTFIVVNTHLSLSYKEKQFPEQQAIEILGLEDNLKKEYDCPIIFTGDFNSDKRSHTNHSANVYEILCTSLTDTATTAPETACAKGKDFESYRVDHIFTTHEPRILRFVILSQPKFANLSDHYPIFIDLML